MENKKLVVGNMKMNLTASEINKYIKEIDKKDYNKQVVFCPSSLYLPYFIEKKYGCGIQNIAAYDMGAYTGEVAAKQVASMKIDYAIIGHSDRREYFKETDDIVKTKVELALAEKIKVILCIGETLKERESLKTYEVLKRQLTAALKGLDSALVKKVIVAYEPVWAIGTGKVPTNQEIEDTIAFIKNIVKETCDYNVKVLYGGSVNDENIAKLNEIPNVDGYLVGGASNKLDKFNKIIEVVVNQ